MTVTVEQICEAFYDVHAEYGEDRGIEEICRIVSERLDIGFEDVISGIMKGGVMEDYE